MKKILVYIFFSVIFFPNDGFSQYKIYLASPGDADAWYNRHYLSDAVVPDGRYELYVNDTLQFSGAIKNFKKNDVWTNYYPDGAPQCTTPYSAGRINGDMICYHHNGAVSYRARYVDDKISGIAFQYYESGKVAAKIFYVNGEFIRRDEFDEDGNVESYYPD